MTQVNDRSAESDETFQREVLERFDANEPPADSALRDELAAWLHEQYGQHTQPNSQRVDSLLAVFTAHLGQQQAAMEADKPWVQAQAMDDAADDLFAEMDGDAWDWTEVFEWLTNRAARLRYNSPSAIAQRNALGADR